MTPPDSDTFSANFPTPHARVVVLNSPAAFSGWTSDMSNMSTDTALSGEGGGKATQSSTWSLTALAVGWVAFVAGYVAAPAVAGVAVLASVPVLWLDARGAIRAGELSTSRPIYIVLAILLLYVLTMPAYLAWRLYAR